MDYSLILSYSKISALFCAVMVCNDTLLLVFYLFVTDGIRISVSNIYYNIAVISDIRYRYHMNISNNNMLHCLADACYTLNQI